MFDTSQELLWTGNDYVRPTRRYTQAQYTIILTFCKGRVTSFVGSELQRYTSFKTHLSSEGPVRQILVNDKGVIALGSNDVHMSHRRGAAIWHIKFVLRP